MPIYFVPGGYKLIFLPIGNFHICGQHVNFTIFHSVERKFQNELNDLLNNNFFYNYNPPHHILNEFKTVFIFLVYCERALILFNYSSNENVHV